MIQLLILSVLYHKVLAPAAGGCVATEEDTLI